MLRLSIVGLALASVLGAVGHLHAQQPPGWRFNEDIDRNFGPLAGNTQDEFLSDGTKPARPVMSPLHPQLSLHSRMHDNDFLENMRRSECLWIANTQPVRLSWEAVVRGFNLDTGQLVDIGLCTGTHPTTRDPLVDSDGDPVEIDLSALLSPEFDVELLQCNAQPFVDPFNTCARHMPLCAALPLSCENGAMLPGHPFCQRDCELTPEEDNAFTARVIDTTRAGRSLDGFAVEAEKRFSPTVRVVKEPASLARLLRPADSNSVRPDLPSDSRIMSWQVAGLDTDDIWRENFSPDVAIRRVLVFEYDRAANLRHYLPIRGMRAHLIIPALNEVAYDPTTYSVIGTATPAYALASPRNPLVWFVEIPKTNSGLPVYIEFTISDGLQQSGLIASPITVDFGARYGGEKHSLPHRLRVQNIGQSSVGVTNIQILGPDADNFHVVTAPSQPIPGNSARSIELEMRPRSQGTVEVGTKRAQLLITTDLPSAPTQFVDLVGRFTGNLLAVPDDIYLCFNAPGDCPQTRSVVVINPYAGNIRITGVTIENDPTSSFSISMNGVSPLPLPQTLGSGGLMGLEITYNGNAPLVEDATLRITSSSGAAEVGIEAQAFIPDPPDISIVQNLVFGVTRAGAPITRKLNVLNRGFGELTVNAVTFSGPDRQAFHAAQPLPLTVAPRSRLPISLQFKGAPNIGRHYNAVATIDSNDPNEPSLPVQLLAVTVVAELFIDPLKIDFSARPIGGKISRPIRVFNVGAVGLTLDGASLVARDRNGAPSMHYRMLDAFGNPLPQPAPDQLVRAGEWVRYSVEYSPDGAGSHTATIDLESDAPEGTVTISLAGKGVK